MIKATDIYEINPSYDDIEPLDLRCKKKAVCETNPLYLDNLKPLDLRIFPKSNLNNTNSINCNQLLNESTNKDITISNSSQISPFNSQSNLLAENQHKRKIDTLYPKLIHFNKINKEEKYNSLILENKKRNDFLYYNKIDIIEENSSVINKQTIFNNINIDKTDIISKPQTSFKEKNFISLNQSNKNLSNYLINSEQISQRYIETNNTNLFPKIFKLTTNNFFNNKIQPLVSNSLINNKIKQLNSNEKVRFYLINLINEQKNEFNEIKPSLISKDEIINKFSVIKINDNKLELNFSLKEVFFKILLNPSRLSLVVIDLTNIFNSIKIIKNLPFKKIGIFIPINYFNVIIYQNLFYFNESIFKSTLNFNYLEITKEFSSQNSFEIIKGNIFVPKIDNTDLKSSFLKNFIDLNINEGIDKLFDLIFPIYNLKNILKKKSVLITNMDLEPIFNEMKIKEFYDDFNKKKDLYKNYKLPKIYSNIKNIPEYSYPNFSTSIRISIHGSIRIITDYFILFFNNIEKIKLISIDQLKNSKEKNEEIKVILENILPYLKRKWKMENSSKYQDRDLVEFRNMISMFIFSHNFISVLLEFWIANKLTNNCE